MRWTTVFAMTRLSSSVVFHHRSALLFLSYAAVQLHIMVMCLAPVAHAAGEGEDVARIPLTASTSSDLYPLHLQHQDEERELLYSSAAGLSASTTSLQADRSTTRTNLVLHEVLVPKGEEKAPLAATPGNKHQADNIFDAGTTITETSQVAHGVDTPRELQFSTVTATTTMDVFNRDMINLGYQSMCVDMRFPSLYRKFCLDSCNVIGEIAVPQWYRWEQACIQYAEDSLWFSQCPDFYGCVFGCEVHGGDGDKMLDAEKWRRREMISKAQISFLRENERCDAMKCRSYCARKIFAGCREQQFYHECIGLKNRPGYLKFGGQCEVDCNSAIASKTVSSVAMAVAVFMTCLTLFLY
ncbi:unnamed protein product [Amoebophrya sp. A120]|nr:unnamed protein product [Amoebophrya sp. A120]|eukprot:GSA120T00002090001.1